MDPNRLSEYMDLSDDMIENDVRRIVIETKVTRTNLATKEAFHEHTKEVIEVS